MPAILITGNVQTGKSTLIRKVLERHPQWRIGGFRTVSSWMDEDTMGVYLLPGDPADRELTEERLAGIRRPKERKRQGIPETFERLGPRLLSGEDADVLVMDEVGSLEAEAPGFQRLVLKTLEGAIPVIGVIKPVSAPFLDRIRALPCVEVILLDETNRDTLADVVEEKFLSLFP